MPDTGSLAFWMLNNMSTKEAVEIQLSISTRRLWNSLGQSHRTSSFNIIGKYPDLVNRQRALFQHNATLFQHNARPHTGKVTRDEIEELDGTELLPHTAFGPDLTSSDCYLFRCMEKFICGKKIRVQTRVRRPLRSFATLRRRGRLADVRREFRVCGNLKLTQLRVGRTTGSSVSLLLAGLMLNCSVKLLAQYSA
ncbi:Histone-lysine N-methyltransferase SETMAR [Eumeta japonica]|uniref:Histone-lysine N-methyltransferase SETMAR n=1 Tax=Eumeta variegata TaxID=151549 RepID=A0A4C1ZEL9_EUMVA|nr:Histone-lysine N-methyltransferase SETMAR [Eumeta japonica]